jgi:hypothetical protein
MFENKINNITITFENKKYSMNNIENFYKNDFELLCSKTDLEIIECFITCGVLKAEDKCIDCNTVLKYIKHEPGRHPYFRCNKRSCKRLKQSLFKNTIFDGMKISIKEMLNLLYAFSCRRSVGDTSETLNLSKKTVMSI